MITHEDYKEMLTLHALTALSSDDQRALREHLATCDECGAELDRWRATAAALAYTATPVEPSAEVRGNILESARAETGYSLSVPLELDVRGKTITMHLLSGEQIETLASGGNAAHLALFTLTCGIGATLAVAIYAGGVDGHIKSTFWAVFWAMTVLAVYFAVMATRDAVKNARLERAIRNETGTVKMVAPIALPAAETDRKGKPATSAGS